MVNELVMPLALAGLQVERDERFAEQVRARAMCRRSSRRSAARPADRPCSSSSSIAICPHTPALPVYAHESFSHVSLPNSTESGIVWKIHRRLPVRTSNPRMKPFTLVLLRGTPPGRCAAPMTTTSLRDRSACRVQADLAGDEVDLLIVVLLQIDDAVLTRIRRPGLPVFALSAISR